MSHRTQITLEDAQYQRLRERSRQTGVGLAELIRRAVDHTYGAGDADAVVQALEESFGAWSDRGVDQADADGRDYVDAIRPARSDRLAEW